jgi:hypothetical protein
MSGLLKGSSDQISGITQKSEGEITLMMDWQAY